MTIPQEGRMVIALQLNQVYQSGPPVKTTIRSKNVNQNVVM